MEQSLAIAPSSGLGQARLSVAPWRSFADDAGWDALATRATEPNPFAERWFMRASLDAFDRRGKVALAALEVSGELAGVVPLHRPTMYHRYPLPHLANWLHSNSFLGAPLVAAGCEHEFWRTLFAWADDHTAAALFLHLRALPAEGPLYAALRDVCASQGRAAVVVNAYERALLASSAPPGTYFDASVSAKKRKELRRQFNRLGDEGQVTFERQEDAAGLGPWVDEFLSLERAGWKGAQGSALACNPAKARFFSDAIAGAAAAGKLERLAIRLDGRPIAMLANFLTSPGAYSFKTAYDERLARYSPGMLLQRENLALLARDDIAWADSCAAPDHPMIERIWREKRRIVRVSVAIGGPLKRAAANLLFRAETGAFPQGLQ